MFDSRANIKCRQCGQFVTIEFNRVDLDNWHNGTLIQDAFPYLTADHRELLMTQICGPCFDAMFGVEENEESSSELLDNLD